MLNRITCAVLLAWASVSPATAEVSAVPIAKAALIVIEKEEDRGNQVLVVHIDNVAKGDSKTYTLSLAGGSKYRAYAVGDHKRILDIDLSISDANGNEVGKDTDDKNVAVVEVIVSKTQQYTLKSTPFELREGVKDGFFTLIIVRVD